MNIKAVLSNLKKKGIRKTWDIHKKREEEKQRQIIEQKTASQLRELLHSCTGENNTEQKELLLKIINDLERKEQLRELLHKCTGKNNAEQKELLIKITNVLDQFSNLQNAADVMAQLDKAPSGKLLKQYFIWEVFPAIYEKESKKPIEHKIVFMENGAPLSPSLTYMRRYVKEHSDYQIDVHLLHIRAVPDLIYFMYAKRYVMACATAEAIFNCTANVIFGHIPELRPETTYIQLWHGCGAFKKCGLSTVDSSFGKSKQAHEDFPLNRNYSYVTIASPETSWVFEEMMGIDKASGIIVPTGISRTDPFFDPKYRNTCYQKLHEIIPESKDKKVILYAPTFRGNTKEATTPMLDIKKFAEALSDQYILILKHHQTVKKTPPIPAEYENKFAWDMTRRRGISINELLTVSDILISDYSSVVFEFSLFERPMIFYTFDIDDYIDERGLYYDFHEITPGPMFDNQDDIIDHIQHINERFDKEEVTAFKDKFMCSCDGHSSERIFALIGKKHSGNN